MKIKSIILASSAIVSLAATPAFAQAQQEFTVTKVIPSVYMSAEEALLWAEGSLWEEAVAKCKDSRRVPIRTSEISNVVERWQVTATATFRCGL